MCLFELGNPPTKLLCHFLRAPYTIRGSWAVPRFLYMVPGTNEFVRVNEIILYEINLNVYRIESKFFMFLCTTIYLFTLMMDYNFFMLLLQK